MRCANHCAIEAVICFVLFGLYFPYFTNLLLPPLPPCIHIYLCSGIRMISSKFHSTLFCTYMVHVLDRVLLHIAKPGSWDNCPRIRDLLLTIMVLISFILSPQPTTIPRILPLLPSLNPLLHVCGPGYSGSYSGKSKEAQTSEFHADS